MSICSTGFARIDLLHLSKLVNLVGELPCNPSIIITDCPGATYNEYLKPTASVLICNEAIPLNHEKLRHTHEWGVPAVNAEWLWSSIRQERKLPFEPYSVQKKASQDRDLELRAHPEHKRSLASMPKNDANLRRSTSIPHKSKTPEADSIRSKHTISESPQKELSVEPIQHPKSQQGSISPAKNPPPENGNKSGTGSPSKRKHPEPESESERPTTAASALDSAVNGLLKHARSAASRSTTDPISENDRVRPRRRKPLLGRVQSNTSARGTDQNKPFSRASSIDTLHEEGSAGAPESMNGHSGRIEFEFQSEERNRLNGIEEIDETPQMTQLDYEDPDAVAMREEFLRHAGKAVDKPSRKEGLVIGEVKELEKSGWGTGRRTRNANRAPPVDEEDEF